MGACLETILARGGSSPDDGSHLVLSVAHRKPARYRAQIFPDKISLDNHPPIGYSAGLIEGAGSASRLTGPTARPLPAGHDAMRPKGFANGHSSLRFRARREEQEGIR